MPLLELDNGERLTEGPAIVQYIADQVPAKNLAPANGTMARYRLQEWLDLHRHRDPQELQPPVQPGHHRRGARRAKTKIVRRLGYVDQQLGGKPYLLGDSFTVADGYLFTVTNWSRPTGVDLSAFPKLSGLHGARGRTAGGARGDEGGRPAEVIAAALAPLLLASAPPAGCHRPGTTRPGCAWPSRPSRPTAARPRPGWASMARSACGCTTSPTT